MIRAGEELDNRLGRHRLGGQPPPKHHHPPPRINVLGASGSGVSTVGRALADALAIPYFDSDDYYHGPSDPPFRNPRPSAERHALITRDLRPTGSWVLGGGVAGWVPVPELDFTRIAFLWVPTEVRLERLARRERARFAERILPGGDMHEDHLAFLQWASHYDAGDIEGKTLARHEAYLSAQSCPVLEFRGVLTTSEIVEAVRRSLRPPPPER